MIVYMIVWIVLYIVWICMNMNWHAVDVSIVSVCYNPPSVKFWIPPQYITFLLRIVSSLRDEFSESLGGQSSRLRLYRPW